MVRTNINTLTEGAWYDQETIIVFSLAANKIMFLSVDLSVIWHKNNHALLLK